MGPDGYVWGKEFISKDPKLAGQYEVDKHWYRFKIWGQSGYNPNLDQAFWQDQLALRFPNVDQALLYRTWQASSEVIAWVNKIHFRQNDAQFAPEMCFGAHGNPQKFHSVDDFLSIAAMPDQGVQSIGHFVHQVADDGLTPFQVAQKLRAAATLLLSGAQQLGKTATDPELKETLHNLEAFGHLAHYYSHKIEGATQVGLFRVTGEPSQKQLAIQSLTAALKDWQAYSLLMDTMYKPQLLARTAMLDPKSVLADVKKDIEIAQSAKLGEVVKVSGDNKLWERDQRKF